MKSRHRVKTYGEVFTPRHMVDRMLDLVREELETGPDFVDKTFLEPAAGDGNFLVAILHRKLRAIEKQLPARGVAGGVAVRPRLDLRHRAAGGQPPGRQGGHARRVLALPREPRCPLRPGYDLHQAAAFLIDTNIVRGDTLTGLDWRGEEIQFSWWNRIAGAPGMVQREPFTLASLRDDALRLHRLRQLPGLPDRQGPRGSEGRCLARRSARSARSSRSSTRGRPRTSPSTTGWEKIGYTEQESADARIAQQASQLSVEKKKLWSRRAAVHV